MASKQLIRLLSIGILGTGTIAGLAAWNAQPPVLIPVWEHGELRVANSSIHVQFTRAEEIEILTPPNKVGQSAARIRVYYLDAFNAAGWELLDVDQNQQAWVFLMRRARHLP